MVKGFRSLSTVVSISSNNVIALFTFYLGIRFVADATAAMNTATYTPGPHIMKQINYAESS